MCTFQMFRQSLKFVFQHEVECPEVLYKVDGISFLIEKEIQLFKNGLKSDTKCSSQMFKPDITPVHFDQFPSLTPVGCNTRQPNI